MASHSRKMLRERESVHFHAGYHENHEIVMLMIFLEPPRLV